MTKKRKWWESEPPPPELGKMMEPDAGHGVSAKPSDYAFWLPNDPELEAWVDALAAIDQHQDPEPLIELLRPGHVPASIRIHLADLLRRKLARTDGRPRTPTYERTAPEALLLLAIERVRDKVAGGMSVEKAVGQEAKASKIPFGTLHNAYKDKRYSSRQMKLDRQGKRRSAKKPSQHQRSQKVSGTR